MDGRLWVTFYNAGSFGMIDPASRQVTVSPVGANPVDVRLIGGQLWVTVSGEDRIALIDPASGAETGSIQVGQSPWKVEEGFGAVWVSNQGDGLGDAHRPVHAGGRRTDPRRGQARTRSPSAPTSLFVGNFGSRSISVIDPG